MKIAFYAPLKSPAHPHPSGDRRIAQLLIEALSLTGWEVEIASELRAWEGKGELARQREIKVHGQQIAAQLIAQYRSLPAAQQPRCWFTYHPYHKAPDWIGTAVSDALNIPYIIAEASIAQKQEHGHWHEGYVQTIAAVRRAAIVFTLNSNDCAGLLPHARNPHTIITLKPFTRLATTAETENTLTVAQRHDLATRWQLNADCRWLLCVAMMRNDSKLESYGILADATYHLASERWQLVVIGDGVAQEKVMALFAQHPPERVRMLGRLDSEDIHEIMRASDLLVWPAHNEAFGMAVLEALGCGLPVVAGRSGGIADIVTHNVTGVLVEQPDGVRMAAQIDSLLAQPSRLQSMSAESLRAFERHHRLDHNAQIITTAITSIIG